MNIGIFTETYKPNINGVVTSIEIKKKELERLGHKVYIMAPYDPAYEDRESDVIRLKSFVLVFQPEYRLAYPPMPNVMKKLKKLKLDIIHAETPFSLGLIAAYMAKNEKIAFLHTYHTLFAEYVHYLKIPVNFTKKAAEKVSAAYCNMCNHIISPSIEVKSELLRYGVNKPITIIPTGIDNESFKSGDYIKVREKLGILRDEKVLVFAGRLGKEKNIDFLMESFHNIKQQRENKIKLLLIGDGPYREELKEMSKKLKIENDVIFAGYIDRGDIAAYYKSADIFVFSSLTETQGLVVLEAMASGIPVVAIKASGVEDMVVDGISGFLTENSVEKFNEKINLILDNKEKREIIIENGLKRAAEFSPEVTIKKLENIYIELVDENNRKKMRKALILRRYRTLKVITKIIRGKKA
jgi:1,2-diacylglycerol 3-alpha-glucosyltransferase